MVIWSYLVNFNLDLVERAKRYTYPGAIPESALLTQYGNSPDFTYDRIDQLFNSKNARDESMAFYVFWKRNNIDDLIYFKEFVGSHPKLEAALSEDWDDVFQILTLFNCG